MIWFFKSQSNGRVSGKGNRRNGRARGESTWAPRIVALVREAWWLVVVAWMAYLALALASYSRSDPGWSFSGAGTALQNKGGAFGAWLSDLLFYLFGLSAWWWVIGCVGFVVAGYRALTRPEASDRVLWLTLLGFALVLAASTGLEGLRVTRTVASLPLGAGGLAGGALARLTAQLLGFNGG